MDFNDTVSFLVLRDAAHPAQGCTIDTCPVSLSVYGYLPSKPLNLAFLAIFAVSLIVHIVQGIKRRAWSFLAALGIGTLMEAVGYFGRFQMHKDPFKRGPLAINIVCLTVAPAFMAAGIYLTLKHLVIILGPRHSRFAPQWYTRIFITCDLLSIIVQTGGSTLSTKANLVTTANGIMEAGIAFQVATLLIFGGLALEFYLRYRKDPSSRVHAEIQIQDPTSRQAQDGVTTIPVIDNRLKRSLIAVAIAYFAILIRCIYRIAEMAGGWRNPIMQDQVVFVVLDGVMCVIAAVVLNVFHPGAIFQKSKLVLLNKGIGGGGSESAGNTSVEAEIVVPVDVGTGRTEKV